MVFFWTRSGLLPVFFWFEIDRKKGRLFYFVYHSLTPKAAIFGVNLKKQIYTGAKSLSPTPTPIGEAGYLFFLSILDGSFSLSSSNKN